MDMLISLIHNRILIAAVIAWTTSQLLKTILYAVIHKGIDWTRFVGDGGMPSSHSATVTAAAACCGMTCGLDSAAFAIAFLLAFITCHDAMHSRQEIGKQAAVLKELTKDRLEDFDVVLKEFVGHTPTQVSVGVLIGLVIGIIAGVM